MKKAVLISSLSVLLAVVILFGFILFIRQNSYEETYVNPPSMKEIEQDAKFYLVSDEIYISRKEQIQNYIIYYVKVNDHYCDHNYNCADYSRYYAMVYVLTQGTHAHYEWKYSHSTNITIFEYDEE